MSDDMGIEKIDLDKVDWRGSRDFFESLGEALDKLDDKDESYDFTWVGKRKSIIEAGAPINKTLRPDVANSKNWDTTENLFIEGDNLDALKLLQESYLGKVKMIYIDPPYNTGKDFVYHDNFKADVEEYDEATEYKDQAGNIQFKKNDKSNGRYHSDWLSMMYPRLKLARNLLRDDGIIFISIDDHEQPTLRRLCDEIFGEDNFIANLVWDTNHSAQAGIFKVYHQYVLVYARNASEITVPSISEGDDFEAGAQKRHSPRHPESEFRFPAGTRWDAKDGTELRGVWGDAERSELTSGRMLCADGKLQEDVTIRASWTQKSQMEQYFYGDADNLVDSRGQRIKEFYFSATGKIKIVKSRGVITPPTVRREYGSQNSISNALADLFGLNESPFDSPKPPEMIREFAEWFATPNDIVLDFFAGSATTAHAIMLQNAIDGGKRKYILVTLNEEVILGTAAARAGFKTIPEISRERIRRAGDKIAAEHPEAKVDYGFRALRIDDTNYKEVYKPAGEQQQSTLLNLVDNIKDDRSELDLLYGVITQSALELNRPLETREIAGSNVFLYDYFGEVSGLVACFGDSISEETTKEIAKLKPLTAVFRDSTFPDSQAKVNLGEHFRILSAETKVKVI